MEKLVIVRTIKELRELQEYIKKQEYIAYDCETTGVDKDSHIIGYSICADVEIAYYVITREWDVAQQKLIELETNALSKETLELLIGKKLIMQNSPFDCSMAENNFDVKLMPSMFHDTMIGGHLLNENRSNGLKERGVELFGDDARKEQALMKDSVHKNGGVLTKQKYELYKADADLIAYYGAKDAILTLKVFYNDVPQLFEQKLDTFFYEEESMPLLRGPTYDMNTEGLRVDPEKLAKLKVELQEECASLKTRIYDEITPYVLEKYPGTGKTNVFNVGATQQRAWLIFEVLGEMFFSLTETGRELCVAWGMNVPYTVGAKKEFIEVCKRMYGTAWKDAHTNNKTGKESRPKKVGDPWIYMNCGKDTMGKLADKYEWIANYLAYAKNLKLLNTYVDGIQSRMRYNVIRPSFLQHGTTSGRYSSRNPNFQNLPRDDKRVKACIIAREGKCFVGADYSQLEPRVFASISQDKPLLDCFKNGQDFYSVVGIPIFDRYDCTAFKDDKNSFAKKYPELRNIAKAFALASAYGTSAVQQAQKLGKSKAECQEIIDKYFRAYPNVAKMMKTSHQQARETGVVHNLFGRPRRIPKALNINRLFGTAEHADLAYEWRNLLNLAMNHRVQSTAASVMNRAAIAVWKRVNELGLSNEIKIVLQVHDELILEGPTDLGEVMVEILKDAMENTTVLPGVKLLAEPKIGSNLAELK